MADFTLVPDYSFETTREYKTLISKFENGTEQRRQKWSANLKSWKLIYKNQSATDKGTILTLFDAKKGAFTAFTWTNPEDSTDYTVRFKEDSLVISFNSARLYDIEFELLQVK